MLNINNPCMMSHARFPSSEVITQHYSFTKVSLMHETLPSKQYSPFTSVRAPKMSTYDKTCNKSTTFTSLARRWREVQGLHDWENLIEPTLDPLLQNEIIRYGKFVAACYDAFDLDPNSPRYLNCKYGKKTVLQDVGMGDLGYEVTKYIYATPEIINIIPVQNDQSSNCGRWVGYVAVSSDGEVKKLGRRDVIVTFRGTVTNSEWIANLMSSLTPACLDPHNPRVDVKVETGFLSLYTSNESETRFGLRSCREQLLSEISRLLNKYKDEELSITIAGHSMGSSLALLLGYDLAELGILNNNIRNSKKKAIPITVFSFAGPRVGNLRFKERCEELGVKVLRIVNAKDPITKLPGILFNENFRGMFGRYEVPWSWCSCYVHVGVELVLDFLKMEDILCVHDLETYINLLKCPKSKQQLDRKRVDILMSKAKELLFKVQNVNISPWREAAVNIVNLVLPQWTRS